MEICLWIVSTYGANYFGRSSNFGSKMYFIEISLKLNFDCVFYFSRRLKVPGKLSKNITTVVDGLIFMIANTQHLSTLIAMSVIIMNLDPLCNIVGMDIASLLIMKVLRVINVAVCLNFYDVYINLVFMVYVLHTSQLVQCGEVLLQWSLLQRTKFLKDRVIVLVTYQMNTS